jgi:hypothetical protein
MNPRDLAKQSAEASRLTKAPRAKAPVREPVEHPQVMAPGANVIENRPWHVERRRKMVQSRSPNYLEDLKRANAIVKSRTTMLRAKKRGR